MKSDSSEDKKIKIDGSENKENVFKKSGKMYNSRKRKENRYIIRDNEADVRIDKKKYRKIS